MGKLTLDELEAAATAGEIDTVVVAEVDMQGRLMGKRMHVRHFLDHGHAETHSCDYLLTVDMEMEPVPGYASANWQAGYGDYVMRPDLSTLRRAGWTEGAALVLADILDHDGETPVPVSPRAILKRQMDRLAGLGLEATMASELEFFLFEQSFEAAQTDGYRRLKPISAYNEDYHIFQTAKEEGVMRALRNGLYASGVPVESTKGEASAGQAELNIRYGDPLAAADHHVIAKAAAKEVAWRQGQAVTFMAKWDDVAAGSSCHIHQALPGFHDPAAVHGMSETMRRYLAGLLRHADEITLLLAPNVNSYKRFQAQTFAPTKAVWSADNRTAGYRIAAPGTPAVRVECRVGGADLNPYMAYAGLLAAGMAGIEGAYELEPEFQGDAYGEAAARPIPTTLRAATTAFDGSAMLRAALGEDVVDHYAHAARWEQSEHDRRVTDWELQRGFERS